ncbi:MAG: ABC transporter ATP-binding protein [Symbiobacteriia bacterium]
MSVIYRIEGLTKVYKRTTAPANDDLTFDIHEGEIFGLLGPNGAGKSTLVNQLAGLLQPTSGSIRLYGIDALAHPEIIPDYIALQPQHSLALWDLHPEEALFHTGRFRGFAASAARRMADDLMEELGLDACRGKQIRRLSGGQKKLVTFATALVGDRPIQIFDEPTNELDPVVRRTVWEMLLERNRRGTTIILVTHNVLEAERVIQRVGIINHGRLMSIGTPGELKERIDQRVRLELLFKAETDDHAALLEHLGEARALSRQHWTILVNRDNAQHAITQVMASVGLAALDDFRILTPSLEDVYLQLGGGAKLA